MSGANQGVARDPGKRLAVDHLSPGGNIAGSFFTPHNIYLGRLDGCGSEVKRSQLKKKPEVPLRYYPRLQPILEQGANEVGWSLQVALVVIAMGAVDRAHGSD